MKIKSDQKPRVAYFREIIPLSVAHIAAQRVCNILMIPRTIRHKKASVLLHIIKKQEEAAAAQGGPHMILKRL